MKPIIRSLMLVAAMVAVLSGMAMATPLSLTATPTLKNILPDDLKKGLTPAEEKLLDKAQKGEPADFTTGDKEKDDPVKAANWGPKRTVRAKFIYWLCTDKSAVGLVHARGLELRALKLLARWI